jgi:predicted nucleic-acid-binding protein
MASLDANCLLRLVLGDIKEQESLVNSLLAKHKVFHVADIAIFEVVYVLEKQMKLTRSSVSESIGGLVSSGSIICNKILIIKALKLYVQFSSLSFADCCLAIYAELNNNLPLYTFDKALARKLPDYAHLVG